MIYLRIIFADIEDTMYSVRYSNEQLQYNQLTEFCKTQRNGQGHLPHFFSELEYERLKEYLREYLVDGQAVALPIDGQFDGVFKYLLSSNGKWVYNYLPWHTGEPNAGSTSRVYMKYLDGLEDGTYTDTQVICQSEYFLF